MERFCAIMICMQPFFHRIIPTIRSLYRGYNLLAQILFCIATYILVTTGFDWWYLQHTHTIGSTPLFFAPALVGFLVPLALPLYFLIRGIRRHDTRSRMIGYALGQAALLGWGVSTFYKVFTGRMGPHLRTLTGPVTDLSHGFRFGIYRGGAFQGWPSSHTATAFAMSFALIALFPKPPWRDRSIRIGAAVYALLIGVGVSTNIHWFSDVVAGAILGIIIGLAVGKEFLKKIIEK